MTPEQVCEFLQVTKDWLYDQVQQNKIPHLRLGGPHGRLRFRYEALLEYLERSVA